VAGGSASWLGPLVIFGAMLISVAWVYQDATKHVQGGRRVIFAAGRFRLEEPTAWAVGCLLLWILFFPLYLNSRD
jgi:hypothetical protein